MTALDAPGLTDLLTRLLADDDLRRRLTVDGPDLVADGDGEHECLATVDLRELEFTVRRMRSQLWKDTAGGGLAGTFPRTVARLGSAGWPRDRLLSEFVRTPEFGRYRELPYAGPGVSLQESFALFVARLAGSAVEGAETCTTCEGTGCDIARVAEHELLVRLLPALVHEHPVSFDVAAPGIVRSDLGYAALRTYCADPSDGRPGERSDDRPDDWSERGPMPAAPVVFAYFATPATFACGPVSPPVAAAIRGDATADAAAARAALRARALF